MLCRVEIKNLPDQPFPARFDDADDGVFTMTVRVDDCGERRDADNRDIHAHCQAFANAHTHSKRIETSRPGGDRNCTEVADGDFASLQLMIDLIEQEDGLLTA